MEQATETLNLQPFKAGVYENMLQYNNNNVYIARVCTKGSDTNSTDYTWDIRAVSLTISLNTKQGSTKWSNGLGS